MNLAELRKPLVRGDLVIVLIEGELLRLFWVSVFFGFGRRL